MRFVLLYILAIVLTACATKHPETTDLKPPLKISYFTVNETLTRKIADGKMEQGFFPSIYRSVLENSLGVFYQCPKNCFYERSLPNGSLTLRSGGFWIPKSPTMPPRLFFVFEPNPKTVQNLDAAVETMKDPITGHIRSGSTGGSIAGDVIAVTLVAAIVESSRGERFLLGEVPDDPIPEHLRALVIITEK